MPARYRPPRIVALGQSLGTGVASGLAPQRPLTGLILVTRFDSLRLWRAQRLPIAIIAAGRDTLVRPGRTDALRRAVPNLAFDFTINEATTMTSTSTPISNLRCARRSPAWRPVSR